MEIIIGKNIDDRGRIFEVNYQGVDVILKKNLSVSERVPFLDKKYSDRYIFLPKIISLFKDNNSYSMLMEKLYPFDYDKCEIYIDDLFKQLSVFQKEINRSDLDISTSNIMMRKNGEIVLFDLWCDGYIKPYTI